MKAIAKLLVCGLLVGQLSLLQAAILLQDDFNYQDGVLTDVSSGKWRWHSGNGSGMFVVGGELKVDGGLVDDCNALLSGGPYDASASVPALYAMFKIRVTSLPSGSGTYFAHFKDSGTGFRARVFVGTEGASAGRYRLGLANGSSTVNVWFPQDLDRDVTYTVVVRYIPQTGVSTLWVDPMNETSTSVTATDSATSIGIVQYAFRQASGGGVVMVDDLVVGTTFADVIPSSAGYNPPFITVQPADTNVSQGLTVSFKVMACGDEPINIQWYYNTNTPVQGATSDVLILTNVTSSMAGTYHAVVWNMAGVTNSRFALLTVVEDQIPPTITNQPQDVTAVYGQPVEFTVGAAGSPPLGYTWFRVVEGTTNQVGGNSMTLTVASVRPSDAGLYFVVVTNLYGSVTSRLAELIVNPPPLTSIAAIRATVTPPNYVPTNTTQLFRARGVVTSKTSLTSAANTLFYMQDETAGIAVYWTGAGGVTSCPPQGALVEVMAPVTHFNGLLELNPSATNPLHSVKILSLNNPLPEPVPLPFDDAIKNDPSVMEGLEGRYVVATNVLVDLSGTTFASVSSGEQITNIHGQTFTMYINAYTDIPGRKKPTMRVNIYGVLGQYDTSSPYTSGYQLIPTAFTDFELPIQFYNVLENLWRPNGQPTNDLSDNPLRPGEKITTYVSARDLGGGVCTLTPLTCPAGGSWATGPVTGTNPTTKFTFTATPAYAGQPLTYSAMITSPSVTYTQTWFVYIPTPAEQMVFISEFLANPTTNSNAPHYNPLRRITVSTNIVVQDEYVEIVNLSDETIDLWNWSVEDAITTRHVFYNGGWGGEIIMPKGAIVVYGGPLNGYEPQLPVPAYPANQSTANGLALNNTGSEIITVRNGNGYPVDRVFYTGSMLSSSGSLTRFPTDCGPFVPQSYVSTNAVTPGLQYAGNSWDQPPVMPSPIKGITVIVGNPVRVQFTNDPTKVSTLWYANDLRDRFQVLFGAKISNPAGEFMITNPPADKQFYFITQQ